MKIGSDSSFNAGYSMITRYVREYIFAHQYWCHRPFCQLHVKLVTPVKYQKGSIQAKNKLTSRDEGKLVKSLILDL